MFSLCLLYCNLVRPEKSTIDFLKVLFQPMNILALEKMQIKKNHFLKNEVVRIIWVDYPLINLGSVHLEVANL